ncbi:MAG: hypothetical protein E6Q97_07555 [Desulfurellales bacterium]|nr:MAG: hypothetical protein E6Q97_07555 [Desulfurellales bacterium]
MPIDWQPPPTRQYWVVFHDRVSPERSLTGMWLKPGFCHCFAFVAGMAGAVAVNPLKTTWDVGWWPGEPHDLAMHFLSDPRCRVLTIARPGDARYYWLTLPNCVGVVKAMLGIKSLAVTPYQLYRDLLNYGAVELRRE